MTNRSKIINQEKKRLKQIIWLYLILLIFEGALRKWLLPSLSTPLLLVREPIAIYLLFIAIKKRWLTNPIFLCMFAVTSVSFIMTLLFGHQNLLVALYGWRIYSLDFAIIFIFPHILNKEDVFRMGRFVLYLSIPMTILISLQFYSPQSAWVNRGIGGDIEGGGFSGANGYFRPPATFSFTSGFINYQLLVGSFLIYYLIENKSLPIRLQIKPIWLYTIVLCYILTIPFSISRTHLFQTVLLLGVLLIGIVLIGKLKIVQRIVIPSLVVILLGFFISSSGLASEGIDAFVERFVSASESESKGKGNDVAFLNRIIYNLGFDSVDNIPFWGYGIGLGTNAGAALAGGKNGMFSFFNGESENARILNESGFMLGMGIILIRLYMVLYLIYSAYLRLRYHRDLKPWLLIVGVVTMLGMGQWGQPTAFGFSAIFAGFMLVLIKSPKSFLNKYS